MGGKRRNGGGQGKGINQSIERGSVYMMRAEGREQSLGNTTRGRMKGREVVITFNTKGAR